MERIGALATTGFIRAQVWNKTLAVHAATQQMGHNSCLSGHSYMKQFFITLFIEVSFDTK